MKNFAIRLSVLVLATTGFASSTVLTSASVRNTKISPIVVGTTYPSPMCAPSDPSHCGMH